MVTRFTSLSPSLRASLLLWSAALLVGGVALVIQPWSPTARLVVGGMLAVASLSLINRLRLGSQVPDWLNHLDAIAGTALISTAILFDGSRTGEFAILYILIGLFVAFFMSHRATVLYGLLIAGAYGAVLWLGPSSRDAVVYWVALVVVVGVSEAVVLSLVDQMRRLAACDPLTGLANRRAWDGGLRAELARSARLRRGLSAAILDLNGFKRINDRDGHLAGDRVLIALADRWRALDCPPGALFARLGGDEFALLVPDDDATTLERLAEEVATTLPGGVTFALGAVTWDGSESAHDLMRRADRKMYRMKESQRSIVTEPSDLCDAGTDEVVGLAFRSQSAVL